MKTINLIRHAKSSWEELVDDHNRSLSNRGLNDATLIGEALNKRNFNVQKIFSSTAKRAKTTSKIIVSSLNIPITTIQYKKELYDFEGVEIIRLIESLPDNLNSVLIFGHNPAFTILANTLGDQYFANIPTCGTVSISFKTNHWLNLGKGKTEFHLFPKELKS